MISMEKMTTGEIIRTAREKAGMEQQELAEKLGISAAYLSQWESGKHDGSDRLLRRMAEIFNLDINELYVIKDRNEFERKLEKLKTTYKHVIREDLALSYDIESNVEMAALMSPLTLVSDT